MNQNNSEESNEEDNDNVRNEPNVLLRMYDGIVEGKIPGVESVYELAEYYRSNYDSPEEAAYGLVRWQNTKCAADGFLTGLPGLAFLPATIPMNLLSTLMFHIQTVCTVALLGGYDLHQDNVRTVVLACLIGKSIEELLRPMSLTLAQVLAKGAILAIPRSLLGRINAMVGVKLFTKFSSKGIVQLGRLVPLFGGALGGFVDYYSSSVIGNVAIETFIKNPQISSLDHI